MKPDSKSRINDFKKKFMDRLDDGNFQINSDVDVKFDLILPDKDISKNPGVNYANGVAPMYEDYDGMIFKG